jgi:hypothetical protein
MLVWISLAGGIIGSENNPANLMFAGVLAVGIGGAIRARGRARGMAVVLFATAAAHGVAALVAAATGWAYTLIPNAVFVGLWLASGVLFRVAARTGTVSQAAR